LLQSKACGAVLNKVREASIRAERPGDFEDVGFLGAGRIRPLIKEAVVSDPLSNENLTAAYRD
jgi:hypothetical protein